MKVLLLNHLSKLEPVLHKLISQFYTAFFRDMVDLETAPKVGHDKYGPGRVLWRAILCSGASMLNQLAP
jgi:hypothetical protein